MRSPNGGRCAVVLDLLEHLRPRVFKKSFVDANTKEQLLSALQRFRDLKRLRRGKTVFDMTEPSVVAPVVDEFSRQIRERSPSLEMNAQSFAMGMRRYMMPYLDHCATLPVEIPGIPYGLIVNGQRSVQQHVAQRHISAALVEMLGLPDGSHRRALSDAHLILSRVFADTPKVVPEFEALRSNYWREANNHAGADNKTAARAWRRLLAMSQWLSRA